MHALSRGRGIVISIRKDYHRYMKEKLAEMPPKELVEEWDKKLQSFGLPSSEELSREVQEQVPVLESIDESLVSASDLAKFAGLSQDSKRAIIEDIRGRNILGARVEDIAERARLLIAKSAEFDALDATDSDVEFRPDDPTEDTRTPEEIEEDLKKIQKIIDDLEKAFEEQEMGDAGKSVH